MKQLFFKLDEDSSRVDEVIAEFNSVYHEECEISKFSNIGSSILLISRYALSTQACVLAIRSFFAPFGQLSFFDKSGTPIKIITRVNLTDADDNSNNGTPAVGDDDSEEEPDAVADEEFGETVDQVLDEISGEEPDEAKDEESGDAEAPENDCSRDEIQSDQLKKMLFDIEAAAESICDLEGLTDAGGLSLILRNLKQLKESGNHHPKKICINAKNRDALKFIKVWTDSLYYAGFGRGTDISTMKNVYDDPEPAISRSQIGSLVILDMHERKDDTEKKRERVIKQAVGLVAKSHYSVFFVVEDRTAADEIEKICEEKLMYIEFDLDPEVEKQRLIEEILNEKRLTACEEAHAELCRLCDGNPQTIRDTVNIGQINAIKRSSGGGSLELQPADLRDCNASFGEGADHNSRAFDKIQEMIGQEQVKETIIQIGCELQLGKMKRASGLPVTPKSMHMLFTGNPGTGKTTMARYIGEYFRELGLLSKGKFFEISRASLIGQYSGWTVKNTKEYFREAAGSVLFVDEAQTLVNNEFDSYGLEALNQICLEMENRRSDIVVIFAGYQDKMEELFKCNHGIRDRFAYRINFPDYSADELGAILTYQLRQRAMEIDEITIRKLTSYIKVAKENSGLDFGNGRFVRRLVERIEIHQAERVIQSGSKDLVSIRPEDVERTLNDPDMQPEMKNESRKIGF